MISDDDALFADVLARLKLAAHEDRMIEAAQLHLINLHEIIKRAGPHWSLVKDKIRLGSMWFLRACVADDDIVIPAGDGFLIIFAHGRAGELKARARELKALLLDYYCGQHPPLTELEIVAEDHTLPARALDALVTPSTMSADVGSLEFMFAPAWSPAPQLIGSYFCVPTRREGEDVRYGYDPHYARTGMHQHRDYLHVDLAMVDVVERAMRGHREGAQPILGVSVHSTTMQNRAARAAYLDRLAKLPAEFLRHIYVEIAELEPGTPVIHLAEWAGFLRARVRNILIECHPSDKLPPKLDEAGIWGAGFQAPDVHNDADALAVELQIARWGESLARQHKRFFVDNLRQPLLVARAAEAGAAFLSSDAFWPCQKWPGGVISTPAPTFAASRKPLSSRAI